jgi:5-methylthioadenosine/S-adenosylhomocysteine deaminase
MPEVLIRNADYVVTVDKDRRMIRDGAIAISGNKIVAVGKTSEVAPRYPNAEVIDTRGEGVAKVLIRSYRARPNS